MRYLVLALLLLPIVSFASSSKTIKLAYSDIESFPFQMGNGNDVATPPGISVEIIEQLAHMLQFKVEYVRVPGKRVLQHIRSNEVDGGFIFSYNHERAQYAHYPIINGQVDSALRIATLDYFLYRLKIQKLEWDGVKLYSTGNRPVGVHTGFSIIDTLKENEISTLEVSSTQHLFKMLRKRRVIAVAVQSNIADSYIDENKLASIEKVYPPILSKYYYLIFSHRFTENNPELVRKIWRTIGDIRDQVTVNSIKKYTARHH
ncbi:transporter substrate-binding domain-containing protein [Vibrio europaeus]|uniref:substrate-binding periplasmic protein n=1 Tax=Vibrio europaeus TaxID=300876 RepID=UPI00233EF08F|nr:transporter substrate-binding domain-containing protein [Vibrio europaeus]MDC5819239.1 transporter substrate-binding domain-containing protein [Vibrio europaeus]